LAGEREGHVNWLSSRLRTHRNPRQERANGEPGHTLRLFVSDLLVALQPPNGLKGTSPPLRGPEWASRCRSAARQALTGHRGRRHRRDEVRIAEDMLRLLVGVRLTGLTLRRVRLALHRSVGTSEDSPAGASGGSLREPEAYEANLPE
jgi:hypothetical protein